MSESNSLHTRSASIDDAAAIASIYNQGIEDRVATFETRLRSPTEVAAWFDGDHPIIVVEQGEDVVGFASTSTYRQRPCYTGIAEVSVYVKRDKWHSGVGSLALRALIESAETREFWKLVSRVFPENESSRSLCRALGFREVGIYEKHSQLDGIWRDVIVIERLLPANIR
jgi:L-amino acid N-acyltransferase YncA